MRPVILFLPLLMACGPVNIVVGAVNGRHLEVHSAAFALTQGMSASGTQPSRRVLTVVLTDEPDACEVLSRGTQSPGAAELRLMLHQWENAQSQPVRAGRYSAIADDVRWAAAWPSGSHSVSRFDATDSGCRPVTVNPLAVSGTVKLDGFSARRGGVATGSFDLVFPEGQTVLGTYSARYCEIAIVDEPTCAE